MKIKLILTIILFAYGYTFYAQDIKTVVATDSIKGFDAKNIDIQIAEQKQKLKELESENKRLKEDFQAKVDADKATEKAKKEAEKKAEKLKKEFEDKQEKLEKSKKKLEKQQEQIKNSQDEVLKKQQKVSDIEKFLIKEKEKLDDAEKNLMKDSEKYSKKVSKGDISPNDTADYEKEKAKQMKKINEIKTKVTEQENKLKELKD